MNIREQIMLGGFMLAGFALMGWIILVVFWVRYLIRERRRNGKEGCYESHHNG